jgi:hypothetical protein
VDLLMLSDYGHHDSQVWAGRLGFMRAGPDARSARLETWQRL